MITIKRRSTNQGMRTYRKLVGPTSKAVAKADAEKDSKYYTRVTPYKGQWAAWTTKGT